MPDVPLDAHYSDPDLAAIYDITCPWSVDRSFYLDRCAPGDRVVDIGCGTGLLAATLAGKGCEVTGVDPAHAMLSIACQRAGGEAVTWVQGTAQAMDLADRFDVAIMTGHAFQTLLDDADLDAAVKSIAAHLAPGGQFLFESRDPDFDWPAVWTNTRDAGQGVVVSSRLLDWDGQYLSFRQDIATGGRGYVSHSRLRFAPRVVIEEILRRNELQVAQVAGDWTGGPTRFGVTRELIFTATKLQD